MACGPEVPPERDAAAVPAADAWPEDSDDELLALPPLFVQEVGEGRESRDAGSSSKTLHCEGNWSVVERLKPAGTVARWICKGGAAAALDQTRVEYAAGDFDEHGGPRFKRDRLCAGAHQSMAAVVALSLTLARRGNCPAAPPPVCVLGGGGLALPMALLAAEPELELQVVELDATCADLARHFFGAEGPRLDLRVGDGLAFVREAGARGPLSALIIDIDFLRGRDPPAELLAAELWLPAWRALLGVGPGPGGAVILNAIGAEEAGLLAVADAARVHAAALGNDLAAAVLEPCGDAVRSRWSCFVPRPSVLMVGPRPLLECFCPERGVALEPLLLEGAPWAAGLCAPWLRELAEGAGLLARFRWLREPGLS